MAKWADYIICAVQMDSKDQYIDSVSVRPDLGDRAGAASTWKRSRVVSAISGRSKDTFVTAFVERGKLKEGAKVEVVDVGGEPFLRTDRNKTKKDNLGSLPSACPSATEKA